MSRIYLAVIALSACMSGNDVSWQDSVDDVDEHASVRVAAGETKHAELVELLPVARSEDGAKRRVVIPGKLYVNVVAKAAVPGPGTANVVVDRDSGWVRSTRYAVRLY